MQAHKVTLLVLSVNDDLSANEIKSEIENIRYPNDCISVEVHDIESAEIGEWDDNHPLNQTETSINEWRSLFPSLNAPSEPACREHAQQGVQADGASWVCPVCKALYGGELPNICCECGTPRK